MSRKTNNYQNIQSIAFSMDQFTPLTAFEWMAKHKINHPNRAGFNGQLIGTEDNRYVYVFRPKVFEGKYQTLLLKGIVITTLCDEMISRYRISPYDDKKYVIREVVIPIEWGYDDSIVWMLKHNFRITHPLPFKDKLVFTLFHNRIIKQPIVKKLANGVSLTLIDRSVDDLL
jgi:hypothetical protein